MIKKNERVEDEGLQGKGKKKHCHKKIMIKIAFILFIIYYLHVVMC